MVKIAHWAEVDEDGKVLRVTVGSNDDLDEGYQWLIDKLGGTWIKASYNTYGGKHSEGGTPLHYNYPGTGFNWDGVGFYAPQPHPSWNLNKETYLWEAPISMPDDGDEYKWNEETKSWDVIG